MKYTVEEKMFTLENIHGHYLMLFPVLDIFPKKQTFRDDYVTIHFGWLVWLLHIKLWFTPTSKVTNNEH